MLSLSYITALEAADYYDVVTKEELDPSLSAQERYYSEKNGIWLGKAARMLHLSGQSVTKEDFTNILNGFSPKGNKQLVQTGENKLHRAGIDWTFSAPKSLSLTAEIIHPELKPQLFEAHNRSVIKALQYFENHYAEARQTTDYVTETVKTGNLAIAAFLERTSRSLDPQLHSHCIIANMTKRADGKWRALTNEQLHNQKMLIGQIYRNYLAREVQGLGMAIELKEKGLFEIKGVPQEMIDVFSTRSKEIKKMLPELREKYPTLPESVLKAMAAQNSRSAKTQIIEAELQEHWQQKFSELKIDKTQLRKDVFNQSKTELKQTNHADLAVKALTQNESVVKKETVLAAALKYSLGQKTIEDVERDLKHAHEAVQMAEGFYSTRNMITLEKQLAKYLKETANSQTSLLAQQRFMLLPSNKQLTASQENALLRTITSGDKVTALQGDAGTGKSQLATVIASNYRRKGFTIQPLSPTALAATGLRDKGLIRSTTIDRFLNRSVSHKGRPHLFILEEASQLGSEKLKKVLDRTTSSDRVLLIGDRNQHQSIDAGAIFKKAQQHALITIDHLKENVRQQSGPEFLQKAVSHLAAHRVEEAYTLLDRNKRINAITDYDERLAAIVEKYANAADGKEPIVITGTNAERKHLNELIRERRISDDKVAADGKALTVNQPKYIESGEKNLSHAYQKGDSFFLTHAFGKLSKGACGEVTAVDHVQNTIKVHLEGKGRSKNATIDLTQNGHHLSTYTQSELIVAGGDKIIFLKNDDTNGIQNGLAGTVTGINEEGILSVKTADNRELTVNTRQYGFFDYSYSMTSFKVQGSEYARVIYHADTSHINRFQNFYVAASRAREDIEILTDDKARFLEQVQEQEIKTSTLDYAIEGMSLDLSISENHE